MDKLAIIIPCHNEEKGVGKVIDEIPVEKLKQMGIITQIIVIDNCCTDKTAQIAENKGALVITEEKRGKGNAIKKGFAFIDNTFKYVAMLDGDNTYKGFEITRMIEPLINNFCDVIVGSRLSGKMKKNSITFSHRVINWGYTFLVRHFYRANVTDVLSGYFAWKKEVIDDMLPYLESNGFAIEMEMITKIVKLGYNVYSVPISYDNREGDSKINSVQDGIKILGMFFKNLQWSKKYSKALRKKLVYAD